jgi:hypothetical protein
VSDDIKINVDKPKETETGEEKPDNQAARTYKHLLLMGSIT